ncbi:sensor domain-containing diguanylate cyclase [Thiomicrospira microaerophila]|uniref:sensor domain-containing diguanylate cyclase n=1 Tax=Thiomicrospira microaerophila TaxID=406020 RepID=UPI0006968C5F|nr:diguanylate cyclase [Thiomicrospira microaerophila]
MNNCLKWQYLLYISVLVFLSVLLRGAYDYHSHNHKLQQEIVQLGDQALIYHQDLQQSLIERYLTLTHHYANEQHVQRAFKQGDREALYAYSNPDYQRLQQDNPDLHVMHYFDPQNITLLRLHQPNNFGDDLTDYRPIVRDANQSKTALQGFEVGKNGITYRITTPLINQAGEHFGLLEFGIRPNYFVERLAARFELESMILVKTRSLGKLINDYQFDTLDNYSIIQNTDFFDSLNSSIDLSVERARLTVEGRHYLLLTDLDQSSHQGELVAKVVVAKDITDLVYANQMELIRANLVNLVVLLLLLAVIYYMFNRYSVALARSARALDDLSRIQDKLKNQANTDELTGLYNRRFFNLELKNLIQCQQTGCLLFFDIDHFKVLNDTYGHPAGDRVLMELGNMMRHFFRQDDLLVRWGGEEFAVFIKHIPTKVVLQKVEAFRVYVEENITQHQPYPVTISGGVTNVRAGDDVASLIERADQRLYQAKQSGRNRIVSAFDEN